MTGGEVESDEDVVEMSDTGDDEVVELVSKANLKRRSTISSGRSILKHPKLYQSTTSPPGVKAAKSVVTLLVPNSMITMMKSKQKVQPSPPLILPDKCSVLKPSFVRLTSADRVPPDVPATGLKRISHFSARGKSINFCRKSINLLTKACCFNMTSLR